MHICASQCDAVVQRTDMSEDELTTSVTVVHHHLRANTQFNLESQVRTWKI